MIRSSFVAFRADCLILIPEVGQREILGTRNIIQSRADRVGRPRGAAGVSILVSPVPPALNTCICPSVQIIVDSLNRVDLDLRKGLYSNILLSGGSTLCRGNDDFAIFDISRLIVIYVDSPNL